MLTPPPITPMPTPPPCAPGGRLLCATCSSEWTPQRHPSPCACTTRGAASAARCASWGRPPSTAATSRRGGRRAGWVVRRVGWGGLQQGQPLTAGARCRSGGRSTCSCAARWPSLPACVTCACCACCACCALLQGDNPVYVWVPLVKPRRRRGKAGGAMDEELSELQAGVGGVGWGGCDWRRACGVGTGAHAWVATGRLAAHMPSLSCGPGSAACLLHTPTHTRTPFTPLHPHPTPPPQVHLRLQWKTEAVRGQSMKVEVVMAGLSLVVMGGLQDELFNLTTDEIKATAVRWAAWGHGW